MPHEQLNITPGGCDQFANRALESAQSYVARSTGAGSQSDGREQAFAAAFRAALQWGEDHGAIAEESEFPFFRRPPDGHGDEHQAWFDEQSNRWFKATYTNRFGLAWGRDGSATAAEYLSRLVLQNHYFGDDIKLVALVNCGQKLRILTSQPHVAGDAAPSEEIQAWFTNLAFDRLEIEGRIAWYRRLENLLVADAHEGNVIKTRSGLLVPIDLNIIQPLGDLLKGVIDLLPPAASPISK